MIKRLFILSLALVSAQLSFAQNDDFGYDLSVGAETKLAKGLKLGVDASMRTQDDAKKIDRYTVGADLSYKVLASQNKKFTLKANAGFDYMWTHKLASVSDKYMYSEETLQEKWYGSNTTEKYWRDRYRFNVGFNASYDFSKRWSVSLKETFQQNHYCYASTEKTAYRPYIINDDNEWITKPEEYADLYAEAGYPIYETTTKSINNKDVTMLYSKLEIGYNIKGYPINLFASADYGFGLNKSVHKWRFIGGYDYKIDKKNTVSLYYRYNTENDDDEANGHLIGLSYKINF